MALFFFSINIFLGVKKTTCFRRKEQDTHENARGCLDGGIIIIN
jgi:hypothetical protein